MFKLKQRPKAEARLHSKDGAKAETPLERAQRQVDMARSVIQSQEALITRMRDSGHGTMQAENVLKNFQQSLAVFEAEVKRLS